MCELALDDILRLYHATDERSVGRARAFFDPAEGSIYLDAATYGLPPRPTVEAMQRGLAAWQAGTADWIHDWDERGEDCRASLRP